MAQNFYLATDSQIRNREKEHRLNLVSKELKNIYKK